MMDPLGNILAEEGELKMRCLQEFFPMLGKQGLKPKTNGNTFLFCLVVGASTFSLGIELTLSNYCLT